MIRKMMMARIAAEILPFWRSVKWIAKACKISMQLG
jgi:hypothetical protein